jgi:type IV pilus assembly protein PilE
MDATPLCPPRSLRRGFTLIELMIVAIVVAILAAVAYPSYRDAIRKSRRSEAFSALSSIQQAQERHRSQQPAFTTSITGAPPAGLGIASTTTQNGYYELAVTTPTPATHYEATATGVTGTSQAQDGPCAVLAVRMNGGNLSYGAGATPGAINWADPTRCWAR